MNLPELKKYLVRNVYFYLIILFFGLILFGILTVPIPINWITLLYLPILVIMFLGQTLLIMPYGHFISYYFYLVSCVFGSGITLLLWFFQHALTSLSYIGIYFGFWASLVIIITLSHYFTCKRDGAPSLLGAFSIFFFGLLFVFGTSKTISQSVYDQLFFLTLALFVFTGVFGVNQLFRGAMLKKELKIINRETYPSQVKDELMKKTNACEGEVDLLAYYLKSALNSFVEGDYERSFMDAYKIVFDNKRKAFEHIYVLPENTERQQYFANIRDALSHAKHSIKGKKENDKERLDRIKESKKKLYKSTLELLKIVKFEFIDSALKA